VGAVSISLKDK